MKDISELIEGHKDFKESYFCHNTDSFKELVEKGQSPKFLFIGCSDSRVIPTMITGAKEGDLFVVRNVGNFVPPYNPNNDFHGTATGIEYAVCHLKVENIIVCGHSYCGACASIWSQHDEKKTPHIKKWIQLAAKTKEAVQHQLKMKNIVDNEQKLRITERVSIVHQLENILTYPYVKDALDSGQIKLHGWYYRMEDGVIENYDFDTKSFKEI
jgi:carbonic anhydrase